jgi:hypothetical protein
MLFGNRMLAHNPAVALYKITVAPGKSNLEIDFAYNYILKALEAQSPYIKNKPITSDEYRQCFLNYLNAKLNITANNTIKVKLAAVMLNKSNFNCVAKVQLAGMPALVEKLEINNTCLLDFMPNQINYIQVGINGKTYTDMLNKRKTSTLMEFTIQSNTVRLTSFQIFSEYLVLGYTHVIPLGFDHILFILAIFFLTSDVRSVIIQCSVFTLAHSITLAFAAGGYIVANTNIIEPVIALSIAFVALENLFHQQVNNWRLIIIFSFGLIHGMGFASALNDIGLPPNNFVGSLLFFNLGVELGQITIIMAAYFLIGKWYKNKVWYRKRIVWPVSVCISCLALYWAVERVI